jgi:hypothetical protein
MTSRFMFDTEEEYREALAAQRAIVKEMEVEIAPYLETLRAEKRKVGLIGGSLNEFREHHTRQERAEVKRQIKGNPTLYHLLDTETEGRINGLYTFFSSGGIELSGVDVYWSFTPPYDDSKKVNDWLRGLGLRGYSDMSWGDSVVNCGIYAHTFEEVRIITGEDGLDLEIPEKVAGMYPRDGRLWGTSYTKRSVSPHRVTAVRN